MNIAYILYGFTRKLILIIQFLYFKIIQLPLWLFSYNHKGNFFKCNGRLFNCRIKLVGDNNKLIIEKNVSLKNVNIDIKGSHNTIIIKEGTVFYEGGRFRIEDYGNLIQIGKECKIGEAFFSASDFNTKIILGDNCLFSVKIILRTSDGHSIIDQDNTRINTGGDVLIDDHVWIGYGATILKGSHIGKNCIIGTEAIVAGKLIPDGSVVVGVGKVVKSDVNWCIERLK
ncbi:MAG: hypothetical protein K2M13_09120 [Muribaculaceae bacterium]|nr:hypothetical protein [Muribaculaceae bacterium]